MLFHTVSLGELAVDAFFLLSGYLITMSMVKNRSVQAYMERRILRIYPAYLAAFVLSVFVIGPWVGIHALQELVPTLGDMLVLNEPRIYPGSLLGLPYRTIDGSMWTISLEFRCYLFIAFLGLSGLLSKKRVILGISAFLILAMILTSFDLFQKPLVRVVIHPWVKLLVGQNPYRSLGLLAIFMTGSASYTWRDKLLSLAIGPSPAAAAVISLFLMLNRHLAEAGLAIFGGFSLFWLCFKANLGPFENINNRWDISYGTYLYAWPITTLVLYTHRTISPTMLTIISLPASLIAGTASWFLIERWTKDLLKSHSQVSVK